MAHVRMSHTFLPLSKSTLKNMSKRIFSFLLFVCFSNISWAQMPTVGGAHYAPATKSALLISFSNGKITKLQYAQGNGKFVNATLKSQSGSEANYDYKFTYTLPTAPAVVYEAVQGVSPLGSGFSVQEVGKYESVTAWQFEATNTPQTEHYLNASRCAFYYLSHFKYINNDTQEEIVAEDSQEGTQENQVILTYKNASGKEETNVANINPTTHEVSFSTPSLGKVRLKLNEMGFEMFNSVNQSKGTFTFNPSK